jgi:hypothetical protein
MRITHRRHINAFKAFAELQYLHRDRGMEPLPKKKRTKKKVPLE